MNGRMPLASAMAEDSSPTDEPGAPIPKDAIDPELDQARRGRGRRSAWSPPPASCSSAVFFLLRLNPDRRFRRRTRRAAARRRSPTSLAGKVDADAFVAVEAEPLMAHAIRATACEGQPRPARRPGARHRRDGCGSCSTATAGRRRRIGPYIGRLRELDGSAVRRRGPRLRRPTHPRPVFATAAAVRAGFATGKVATVAGDEIDRRAIPTASRSTSSIRTPRRRRARSTSATRTPARGRRRSPPRASRRPVRRAATESRAGALRGRAADAVADDRRRSSRPPSCGPRASSRSRVTTRRRGASSRRRAPAGFTVDGDRRSPMRSSISSGSTSRANPERRLRADHRREAAGLLVRAAGDDRLALIALLFAWALVRAVKRDLLPTRVTKLRAWPTSEGRATSGAAADDAAACRRGPDSAAAPVMPTMMPTRRAAAAVAPPAMPQDWRYDRGRDRARRHGPRRRGDRHRARPHRRAQGGAVARSRGAAPVPARDADHRAARASVDRAGPRRRASRRTARRST